MRRNTSLWPQVRFLSANVSPNLADFYIQRSLVYAGPLRPYRCPSEKSEFSYVWLSPMACVGFRPSTQPTRIGHSSFAPRLCRRSFSFHGFCQFWATNGNGKMSLDRTSRDFSGRPSWRVFPDRAPAQRAFGSERRPRIKHGAGFGQGKEAAGFPSRSDCSVCSAKPAPCMTRGRPNKRSASVCVSPRLNKILSLGPEIRTKGATERAEK